MNEVDRTVFHADSLHNLAAQAVCEEFETAWQLALAGGPLPQLAAFLQRGPDAQLESLERALEQIEHRYAQLASSNRSDATIDIHDAAVITHRTLDGPPPNSVADSSATLSGNSTRLTMLTQNWSAATKPLAGKS